MPAVAPFIAAADAFSQAFHRRPDDDVDQQLLDEAMRQSLQDSSLSSPSDLHPAAACTVTSTATPQVVQGVSLSQQPVPARVVQPRPAVVVSAAPPPTTPTTVAPPPAAAPKLMARFVRDVNLPDGTILGGGTSTTKTWRVRNDGSTSWPAGVVLACSGGDLLTAPDLALPVGQIEVGGETDISVEITVPESTGRHVAYFRLKTKEGAPFGQRLWVDLRVTDDDEWTVVKDALPSSAASSSSSSSALPAPAPAPSATVAVEPADAIPEDHWTRVWAKELHILNEMGFASEALEPLLVEFLVTPVSASPERAGIPRAEGIQRLVAALLAAQSAASD